MLSARGWRATLVVFFLGCASTHTPAGLPTQELLRRAEGFLDDGAYKEALEAYETLLQRPLPREIEREALYETGQLALHEGRSKEAASYLSEYLEHDLDAQGREEAIKKLALALMDLRDYGGAKAWLARLGPSGDWLVHAYRYNASKGLQEPRSEKIVHLVRAIALVEDSNDLRELEGLLLEEFADTGTAGFSSLIEKTQDPEAKEAAFYAWLLKARQEENSSEIVRCLGAWRKAGGPKVLPANVLGGAAVLGVPDARLKQALERPRKKIGMLLPIQGSFAPLGAEAIRGALLGVGAFSLPGFECPDIAEVIFLDTSEGPFLTEQRLEEFANDPDAVLAIGPVVSDLAVPLASRANTRGLPIVLLAPRTGLTRVGPWVFRNAVHAKLQAKALVGYALGSKKLGRLAVAYSDDAFGRELSEAFYQTLQGAGGTVPASISYGQGDEEALLSVARRIAAAGPDGVFVADSPKQGARLIRALRGMLGPSALILAANTFNDPYEAGKNGSDFDGVVFADSYDASATRSAVRRFEAGFARTFHVAPSPLAARTFDTVGLALRVLEPCLGVSSDVRKCVAEGLGGLSVYVGVSSPIHFDEDRDLAGDLFLFQIQQGRIVRIP